MLFDLSKESAMIQPSFLFTDHAVLQRDRAVTVWGVCDCRTLTVSYLSYTAEATVKDGTFTAILPPMPARLTGDLVFTSESEGLTLHDVVTGDIYLAGGQSNMEHPLFCTLYDDEDLTADDGIRLFTVPRRPFEGADILGWHFQVLQTKDTPWMPYNQESVLRFCAVGAYFAKHVRKSTDIPIGIISCNWGATIAENWTDRDRLLQTKLARFEVDEYDREFGNIDMAAYQKEFDAFEEELRAYAAEHDAIEETRQFGKTYILFNDFHKQIPRGPYHYKTPGNLRRTMLARLTPLAMRGVLWYQGESNVREPLPYDRAEWFREIMDTMIADWRDAFQSPELPFYIVQLSTFPRGSKKECGREWVGIRSVQEALGEEKNIHTVVSTDIGEINNIHPANKKPVGERLARAALANEYGLDIPWQSPKIERIDVTEQAFILHFSHTTALIAKDGKPSGFFVTLSSGTTVAADATIRGDAIEIPNDGEITAIGYCNRDYAVTNVYNEHGLPLFPFERMITNAK